MSARLKYNRFRVIARQLEDAADKVTRKAAFDCERIAVSLVPVGTTGNLKGSIQTMAMGGGVHSVIVGAEYAAYVEYGTVHSWGEIPAQPYLEPAFNRVRPGWLAALATLEGRVRG